uniref:Small ribosomal subunit protein bS20c n=1 Tax=Pterocladia lucida TaxID=31408 RepID=A0A6M3WVV7_PTELU|nr:ribosomal protein S20 [Pterocladia lucida]
MSKNLSAIKKHKVSLRNTQRNKVYKSIIKTKTKKCLLEARLLNDTQGKLFSLSEVYQIIDKAVNKGILHKNRAARKKSSLSKQLKIIS